MMRNAPRIMPLPSHPFLAPVLNLVAVRDGVPAAAVGPVVVGGTVPVGAPDGMLVVLVTVVGGIVLVGAPDRTLVVSVTVVEPVDIMVDIST